MKNRVAQSQWAWPAWKFLLLAALVAPSVSQAAFERLVCTAGAGSASGVPVLEKVCDAGGTQLETCTSFALRLPGQAGGLTDKQVAINRNNEVLVFKPSGLASFEETVAGTARGRWLLNFIDNSGSPSRAEEAFLVLDADLKPIGPLMNMTEAGDYLQQRGAKVAGHDLQCLAVPTPPAAAASAPAQVKEAAPSRLANGAKGQRSTGGDGTSSMLAMSLGIAGLLAGAVVATLAALRGKAGLRIGGMAAGAVLAAGSIFALVTGGGAPAAAGGATVSGVPEQVTAPAPPVAGYRVTGAPRTSTMVQGMLLCSDPEVVVQATRQEAAAPRSAHGLPDGCTITTQEYKIAILRKFTAGGIEIAQVEFSDQQAKPAYARVIRDARVAVGGGAAPPRSPSAGAAIRAGGWICNSHYEASGNARLLSVGARVGFQGCTQIGAQIPVNVLDRTHFNGYELVQVGNAGGVGWVWADDLLK